MSRVRGPNSALTEFLRERGIDALAIRQRYEEAQREQGEGGQNDGAAQEGITEEDGVVTVSSATSSRNSRRQSSEPAARVRSRVSKKKKRDAEDEDDELILDRIARPKPGQIEFCAECNNRFTVTAYSKPARDGGEGLLCHSCGSKYAQEEKKQKKTQISSRKKRKSVAAALLDKQDVMVPKLQDLCIKLIARYIDDVDMLGDIGEVNMDKIARILSRNRSLKDNTVRLFLVPSVKQLRFWDCSNLCSDSYKLIASFCPQLESLVLSMCGQMTDEVLDYFTEKLEHLHAIAFNGAFLIRNPCWINFFTKRGSQLTSVAISNTLRFDRTALQALVDNCADTLEELSLSRVGNIFAADLPLLLKLTKLISLEISYMRDALTDDVIIDILKLIGPQLITLNLDDCDTLSDRVLLEGIRPYCGKLQNLSLGLGENFTNEALATLFRDWEINNGLINVSLMRCTKVGDEGVQALIEHSAKTLVILNINSVYSLTDSTFHLLATSECEFLSQLDIGFVHCVGDKEVEMLSERCPSLQLIEAYGNIRITEVAKMKPGVRLIGRQSDTI
ncbi:hypothetical protein BZA70DRAFT_273272 [Myxozyma melibiosi]|uniref:DNA repair protein rhp7 treble clef domain-containing protein n=1 Tax=Myxozyma melibiosi TaxID=54550 RepID=A0ABR1FET0_9ASCO